MKRRRRVKVYRLPRPIDLPSRDLAGDMRFILIRVGIATALLCLIVLIAT